MSRHLLQGTSYSRQDWRILSTIVKAIVDRIIERRLIVEGRERARCSRQDSMACVQTIREHERAVTGVAIAADGTGGGSWCRMQGSLFRTPP